MMFEKRVTIDNLLYYVEVQEGSIDESKFIECKSYRNGDAWVFSQGIPQTVVVKEDSKIVIEYRPLNKNTP